MTTNDKPVQNSDWLKHRPPTWLLLTTLTLSPPAELLAYLIGKTLKKTLEKTFDAQHTMWLLIIFCSQYWLNKWSTRLVCFHVTPLLHSLHFKLIFWHQSKTSTHTHDILETWPVNKFCIYAEAKEFIFFEFFFVFPIFLILLANLKQLPGSSSSLQFV